MAENSAPGTPKVFVEVPGYPPQVQEKPIDTNRVSPAAELSWVARTNLLPPARFPDALLQAGTWIGGSAFVTSILRALPPIVGLVIPLTLLLGVLLWLEVYCWVQYPSLRTAQIYKGLMIAGGVSLAVVTL